MLALGRQSSLSIKDEITMSISIHPRHSASTQLDIDAFRSRFTDRTLMLCFVTIAAISALDTWFAVANASIMDLEKNPVCLALMKLEPHGFTCFIAGKSLGTLMVLLCLLALHHFSYQHTKLVALGVALFQVGLLTYLTLSDPHTHGLPNFSLLFEETRDSIWILR